MGRQPDYERLKNSTRSYARLFKHQKNVDKAIKMLNDGFSYSFIGYTLDCDRTSVMSFHRKKLKEGFIFSYAIGPERRKNIFKYTKAYRNRPKYSKKPLEDTNSNEKINLGMDYKDYLAKYAKGRDRLQKKNMEKAVKTIKNARKSREKVELLDENDIIL